MVGSTSRVNWRPWCLALLLALLWHVAWLLPRVPWEHLTAPPRVEVNTIDPKKLEAIRRSWDKKQLLLDRDKNAPKEAEVPKDARYFSDRNRTVEKEQRARESTLIPRPGSRTAEQSPPQPATPGKSAKRARALPKLGNLGVALPPPAPDTPENPAESAGQATPAHAMNQAPGGDQYVKDPNLPEGSQNLLNSQESVFYSFYARLYDAIAPIWQSRLREIPPRKILEGDYTTVVDVIFDRNGALVGIEKNQPSGVEEFDQAVNDAWNRVGRFPNPPQGLLDESGKVHTGWAFTVRIQGGMPFQLMPPERNY